MVRQAAKQVAAELGWSEDWLNDAAKGYLVGLSEGPLVYESRGVRVWQPAPEQLLTMKLSAWRDEVDIDDARRLLQELHPGGERDATWKRVEPYLVPGRELKAQYAFLDLWESIYGDD